MEEEVIVRAAAELAGLSEEAKSFVHQVIGEAEIAREHAIYLGSRFAAIFAGDPPPPAPNPLQAEVDALKAQVADLTKQLDAATAPPPAPETPVEPPSPSPAPDPLMPPPSSGDATPA